MNPPFTLNYSSYAVPGEFHIRRTAPDRFGQDVIVTFHDYHPQTGRLMVVELATKVDSLWRALSIVSAVFLRDVYGEGTR
jgi:hypothetical protein